MDPEKNSQKTAAPDPQEALDELGDAIDEMESTVTTRAKETVSELSPGLKTGIAIGALALGAGAVIFALNRRQRTETAEPAEGTPSRRQMSPCVRDVLAEAAGKAIRAGFAALARRVAERETDR